MTRGKGQAMAGVRTVRRTLGAAIGLVALAGLLVPATAVGQEGPAIPGVGPEHPVADPVPATPQRADGVAVASGGGVHLVVMNGVRAIRVDGEASVIDPSPIPLSETGWEPDVAFDGENFLVVWQDRRLSDVSVRARRVSPEGQVLDAEDIVVSTGEGDDLRISFDGTNFLVVWIETEGIHRALVSPDGTVVDPAGLLVPTVANRLEVAFDGSNHLVVWDVWPPYPSPEPRSVRGTLVTPDGSALHPEGFPISASAGDALAPSVAALGSTFLVAWSDTAAGGQDIRGARVDAAGTVLDPSGIPIAATPADDAWPQVASDGTNFLVQWNGLATRLAPSGAVLDPDGIVLPAPVVPEATALTFDGEQYLAVADDRGTRITTGGVVLDPAGVPLVAGANRQADIDSASDGTNTFVVWSDDRRDGAGIHGARVGPDGQALDGTGIPISDGPGASGASVDFDGTTFLVAWKEVRPDGQYVRAARVSRTGEVLDRFDVSRGEAPETELLMPTVASGDGLHLVAWGAVTSDFPNEPVSQVRAARVGPDGTVLDPAGILVTGSFGGELDVARGDDAFLVVWSGTREEWDIQGSFVTDAGTVPDPDGFPVSNTSEEERDPKVAWNGTTYLVVWWNLGGSFDVHGSRLDSAGTVLLPGDFRISNGPGADLFPTVAANGPFFVTWIDRRSRIYWRRDALVATRIEPDGTIANPGGYPVVTGDDPYPMGEPALTAAPDEGDFSLAYARFVAEQPFGSDRAFVRTVTPK